MTRQAEPSQPDRLARNGRLQARPHTPSQPATYGLQHLGLGEKDVLLYVPASYQPAVPAPLAVLCHGAGGKAEHGLSLLQPLAEELGLLLLAPASRRHTWDMIVDSYGPDIALIDAALTFTFSCCAVDPTHLAIGGFSDGASYALSVGLMNGDLFSHLLAFSPGFMAPLSQHGMPHIFIAHGIHDEVLPIYRCSRRMVPELREAGYPVDYQEFDGPHTVPPAITRAAATWFVGA